MAAVRDVQIMWRGPGPGPDDHEPVSLKEALAASVEAVRLAWSADRTAVLAAVGVNVAMSVAELVQVRAGGAAVEAVTAGARPASQARRAITAAACTVVVVAGQTASFALKERMGHMATHHAEGRVLDVVASLELADVEDPEFQDRMQKALMGAGRYSSLLRSVFDLPTGLTRPAAALLALNAGDRALIPLALVGAVPQWALTKRLGDPSRTFGLRSREVREAAMLRHYLTGTSAAHELRAFGATPVLRERHDELRAKADEDAAEMHRKNALRMVASRLASRVATGPAAARILYRFARKQISAGDALAGGVATQRVTGTVRWSVEAVGNIRRLAGTTSDYTRFVVPPPEVPTGPYPQRDFARIAVEDVHFTYRGADEPVLRGVDLEIGKGEVVALVGENGCGKTTLAKLICCLYRPTKGRIRWDDVDLGDCDPAAVRQHIAVVFQDFVRYGSLSAAENIGIGRPDRLKDRTAIVEAAKAAGAHDLITALPRGYDTPLARPMAGVDLSTGQWQRVALARAFLRDAPLVVLDEPTAALDPRAERDLFETVARLYRSRSALLISHRLSSVRFADRICVLADGRITETGTHEQLLALGGTYAELFEMQAHAYR
jgi:ATP-binding cassette subfamily B protein